MSLALRTARPPSEAIDEGSFNMLAELVHAEAGILLSHDKKQLVRSRLAHRLKALGLQDHRAYIARMRRDPAERIAALDALTTNHTKFFREDHHFRHIAEHVWPSLQARLAKGGRVRLWSAGCSSGEEPYTLAMRLTGDDREAARRLGGQDFRFLATDISVDMLCVASTGLYPERALAGIPPRLRATWVREERGMGEMVRELRALLTFRQLNLVDDWPMTGQFDVILCRNVMIYFDEPTKFSLQARMAGHLREGGLLCIGHSERLGGLAERMLRPIGQTMYRKVTA